LKFIVIGEGAIGASKTTVEMMGGRILEPEPIFLIVCILLVLVGPNLLIFSRDPTKSSYRFSYGPSILTTFQHNLTAQPGSKYGPVYTSLSISPSLASSKAQDKSR
jgi:hypothetical protein